MTAEYVICDTVLKVFSHDYENWADRTVSPLEGTS